MDQERWEQVQSVFHDALDRPEAERAEFLKSTCGGDDGLRAEVTSLLKEEARELRCWITI